MYIILYFSYSVVVFCFLVILEAWQYTFYVIFMFTAWCLVLLGPHVNTGSSKFSFLAPSTCENAVRVLRALQLRRPILLEGSPGVGKTSLVAAVAKVAGHQLVRINLSEQTVNTVFTIFVINQI